MKLASKIQGSLRCSSLIKPKACLGGHPCGGSGFIGDGGISPSMAGPDPKESQKSATHGNSNSRHPLYRTIFWGHRKIRLNFLAVHLAKSGQNAPIPAVFPPNKLMETHWGSSQRSCSLATPTHEEWHPSGRKCNTSPCEDRLLALAYVKCH